VAVQPIGFLHDHVEVLFDLDHEAQDTARELGMKLHRAGTVGDHPGFIELLARRVLEVLDHPEKAVLPPPSLKSEGPRPERHAGRPSG
jgi:ferrochelatase